MSSFLIVRETRQCRDNPQTFSNQLKDCIVNLEILFLGYLMAISWLFYFLASSIQFVFSLIGFFETNIASFFVSPCIRLHPLFLDKLELERHAMRHSWTWTGGLCGDTFIPILDSKWTNGLIWMLRNQGEVSVCLSIDGFSSFNSLFFTLVSCICGKMCALFHLIAAAKLCHLHVVYIATYCCNDPQ